MGKRNSLKGQSSKKDSGVKGQSQPNRFKEDVAFSFKELDSTQHLKETFECWNSENLLLKLLNKIKDISKMTMDEATRKNAIKPYGYFPPAKVTEYKPPKHIDNAEQKNWAVMHIQGKEVVAGHIVENIFYIVFLDREHKFWKSELKHT